MCWGSESWQFSFLLYSCLHHWLPHHTEDLGDLFHACPYFISKNKQHRGEIAKPNSMHRVSQASAQNPISCFRALTMTRHSGCQAGREPSPRGVPATHCEAKWALQGSLATSCRYGAAVWLLCFLRQASREGEMWVIYLVRAAHCVFQDDGQLSVPAGEQLADKPRFKGWLHQLLNFIILNQWLNLSELSFPHLSLRDARVYFRGALADSGGMTAKHLAQCLVHSVLVSYRCHNSSSKT